MKYVENVLESRFESIFDFVDLLENKFIIRINSIQNKALKERKNASNYSVKLDDYTNIGFQNIGFL